MEVDAIARVDDAPTTIDKVMAGVQQLGIEAPAPVELTPQERALAAVAAAAKREKEGDWDIAPHPMLEKGTPSRLQFDEPATTPVVLMRNPIAGACRRGVCGAVSQRCGVTSAAGRWGPPAAAPAARPPGRSAPALRLAADAMPCFCCCRPAGH